MQTATSRLLRESRAAPPTNDCVIEMSKLVGPAPQEAAPAPHVIIQVAEDDDIERQCKVAV